MILYFRIFFKYLYQTISTFVYYQQFSLLLLQQIKQHFSEYKFEVHFFTDHMQLFAIVDRELVFICDLKNSDDAEERARIWMGI